MPRAHLARITRCSRGEEFALRRSCKRLSILPLNFIRATGFKIEDGAVLNSPVCCIDLVSLLLVPLLGAPIAQPVAAGRGVGGHVLAGGYSLHHLVNYHDLLAFVG